MKPNSHLPAPFKTGGAPLTVTPDSLCLYRLLGANDKGQNVECALAYTAEDAVRFAQLPALFYGALRLLREYETAASNTRYLLEKGGFTVPSAFDENSAASQALRQTLARFIAGSDSPKPEHYRAVMG